MARPRKIECPVAGCEERVPLVKNEAGTHLEAFCTCGKAKYKGITLYRTPIKPVIIAAVEEQKDDSTR